MVNLGNDADLESHCPMTQILINSKPTLGQTGISLGGISKMLLKTSDFCCSIMYFAFVLFSVFLK